VKLNNSAKRRVSKLLAMGWQPGLRLSDYIPWGKPRRQRKGDA